MSRHRGYGDRSGRKRREVRLDEQRAGTAHAARRDILLRYAITHPTVARLWMCRQQSGRVKPAFRTRAAAVAADALMAQLEGGGGRCARMSAGWRTGGKCWVIIGTSRHNEC
jgi:hypothetical protein